MRLQRATVRLRGERHDRFDKVLTWNDKLVNRQNYIKHNFTVDWQDRYSCWTAEQNFNARNDRIATPIPVPFVPIDGSSVDHTLNKDGSADVSFEWIWTGDEIGRAHV